jgi:hypothetical protein
MSNFQEKDDWWQGVDGKWYPPVARRVEASPTDEPEESVYLSQVRPNRRRMYLLGLIAVVVTAIGVFVYQERKVEYRTTHFGLELIDRTPDSSGWSVRADCSGVPNERRFCLCELSDGYSDLNNSTPVVVFGKSGKELGRTTLAERGWVFKVTDELGSSAIENLSQLPSNAARRCEWSTADIELPDNEEYFVAKIGNRGEIKFELGLYPTLFTIEDD